MNSRLFAACLLAAFFSYASCADAAGKSLLSDTGELSKRLAAANLVIVDAEDAASFARAHIPGAVNLPYMSLDDPEENAKTGRPIFPQLAANKLGALGIGNDTEVVVYDSGNGRGASAVWYVLSYLGHDKVRVLDGGFRKWVKEGHKVSQEAALPAPVRYLVKKPREDWTMTTAQLSDGKSVLVDARSIAEFAGKEDGGARQAGHIPGAVSFPWDRLGGALSTFKDDGSMRTELKKAGLTPDKEIVTYCNPGIGRSTYLLLAMTKLGYGKVRVYPGSYIEWASDPARPVSR
ncbi:MAG: sulfurtransferase [Rhodospirillales bacterium]|nr:sulfurtransferase [Rhodospirillales bacterium]